MISAAGRIALVLLAVFPAGCARSRSENAHLAGGPAYFGDVTPPEHDVFTFNLGAEPESFDPALATGQPDGRVCRLMFEGLTQPDPRTLETRPAQAYRWDVSADGLTYTFHLRPGLTWTDGHPVTAEDFRWSWIRVLRPATGSRYANLLGSVVNATAFTNGELTDERQVGIAAPDDSTLVVRLAAPTAYFLDLTQFYTLLPVPRWTIEQHGNRWTQPANVVSNGPFVLRSWRQNDRFEFTKNPRFWNAAVSLTGGNPRKRSARMDDWSQEPARGHAVAKFHAVGDKTIHTEVPGERAQDVVQRLAEQYDRLTGISCAPQCCNAFLAQLWL